MWSGKSPWPLTQQPNSDTANNGQVDWAALAQAWIQQKSSGEQPATPPQKSLHPVMSNTQPQQSIMAPNNHIPHHMQWQQQQGPPWQNPQMTQNQNWNPNMYQQPPWQRPPQPEQWNQTNAAPQQWQGNYSAPWFGNNQGNVMHPMQQNMENSPNLIPAPTQHVECVQQPDIQNGRGLGSIENIQPPPPLPDLPAHHDVHIPSNDRPMHQEFDCRNDSEEHQRFPKQDDYQDQNDFHRGQSGPNQWMGDQNPRWEDDGGENWGASQQVQWTGQDNGDVMPPLMSQQVFDMDGEDKMDLLKQRKLPRWLREGLEKMEKEKQKKMEKEEMQKKADLGDQHDDSQDPLKSKFDSDKDESDSELSDVSRNESIKSGGNTKSDSESDVEEQEKTEEEKQMELMIRVRRMLTEVLLDITNTEAQSIAEEVFAKEKKRVAQANAIAKQNSSTSQFGLIAGYGSESDEESDHSRDSEDDTESEDIQKNIERKKKDFNSRQQEVLRVLEDTENKRVSVPMEGKSDEPTETLQNEDASNEHGSKLRTEDVKEQVDQEVSTINHHIVPRLRSGSSSSSSSSSSSASAAVATVTAIKENSASRKNYRDKSNSRSPLRDKDKKKSPEKTKSRRNKSSRSHDDYRSKERKKQSRSRRSVSRDRKRSRERRSGSRERHKSRSPGKSGARHQKHSRNRSRSRERRRHERHRSRSMDSCKYEKSNSSAKKKRKHRSSSEESVSDVGKSLKVKSKSKVGKKVKKKKKHGSSDEDSDSPERKKSKKSTGKRSRRKQSH